MAPGARETRPRSRRIDVYERVAPGQSSTHLVSRAAPGGCRGAPRPRGLLRPALPVQPDRGEPV